MLAHVVDAALKHDRDAARAATRGAAPYAQKSKSKVAALDALLIRAEADDDEDAAAQQPPRQEAAVLGQFVVALPRGLRRRVRDELEDAFQRRGVFIIIGLGPDQ